MNTSDWVLIGTTLVLGTIALIAPTATEYIKRRWRSPKITLSFSRITPYCHKTFYRLNPGLTICPDPAPIINEPVFFFRFKVQNTGKSRLNSCEAVLEQLWIYDSANNPQKLPGFNDVSLLWADSNKQPIIDIGPRRSKYCNLGHVASVDYQDSRESSLANDIPGLHLPALRFMFELAHHPHSQPNCLVPGNYAIKVVLYSDNAPPEDLFFQIAWSGRWQDDETEMFRELAINKIAKIA